MLPATITKIQQAFKEIKHMNSLFVNFEVLDLADLFDERISQEGKSKPLFNNIFIENRTSQKGELTFSYFFSDISPGRTPSPKEASITAPRQTVAAGEHKKRMRSAISSGSINLPIGSEAIKAFCSSGDR